MVRDQAFVANWCNAHPCGDVRWVVVVLCARPSGAYVPMVHTTSARLEWHDAGERDWLASSITLHGAHARWCAEPARTSWRACCDAWLDQPRGVMLWAVDDRGFPVLELLMPVQLDASWWAETPLSWARLRCADRRVDVAFLEEMWCSGRWREPYAWATLDAVGRGAYFMHLLQHLRLFRRAGGPRRADHVIVRGELITCEASLWLALGEAMAGPAGYVGRSESTLDDYMSGALGVCPPRVLRWAGFDTTRQHIDGALLDDIIETLEIRGLLLIPE